MKKLFFVCFILVSTFAKAQDLADTLPHKDDKVFYEIIKSENDKTKNILFNAALLWLHDKSNAQKTILVQDIDQGQIIARGIFKTYEPQDALPYRNLIYDFKIQIDCKDDKFRLQIFDIASKEVSSSSSSLIPLEWNFKNKSKTERENANHLDNKFRDLMATLEGNMDKASGNDF